MNPIVILDDDNDNGAHQSHNVRTTGTKRKLFVDDEEQGPAAKKSRLIITEEPVYWLYVDIADQDAGQCYLLVSSMDPAALEAQHQRICKDPALLLQVPESERNRPDIKGQWLSAVRPSSENPMRIARVTCLFVHD